MNPLRSIPRTGRAAAAAWRRNRRPGPWLGVLACLAVSVPAAHSREREQAPVPDRVELMLPGPEEIQILTLKSGSTLIGRIVEISEDEVRFTGEDLDLRIPVADIREVRSVPASAVRSGSYWFPNPNSTRHFFAPTARTLPQGSGYLADHLLFFPSVTYGITDNVTLGGGVSLFPGVSFDEQLAFVTPKVGWKLGERFDLAVGALLVAIPGEAGAAERDHGEADGGGFDGAGIVFSVATWGTPDASVTAGLGHGYAEGDWADQPMLMLGGERRVSRRISLVSENWVFPGLDGPLVSVGARFMGERLSVDFAIAHMLGDPDAWLPLVGFAFGFGDP